MGRPGAHRARVPVGAGPVGRPLPHGREYFAEGQHFAAEVGGRERDLPDELYIRVMSNTRDVSVPTSVYTATVPGPNP